MRNAFVRGAEATLYVVALIVLWWAVVKAFGVSPLVIPSPERVLGAGITNFTLLALSTGITLGEALAGFAAAVVTGVLLAVAIVSSRLASRLLLPTLVAVNSAPKVVFAPILVIWFGLGLWSKVGMAFLLCFFPIVINAAQGLREVDPELIDLYRLMQAGNWTTLRRVRFPNAIPYILSAMKIALPLAIIGAVIGEFVAARAGIGYQVMLAYSNSDTELVFAAVLLLTIASVLAFALLGWAESLMLARYPVSIEARA
ncbi:MAG: ABC transporter permease [Candidatus Lustribacter sp.]|jgi:NitT/TauT family transport system permease protein